MAKKLILFYFFVAMLLSCIATGYVAQREYAVASQQLVEYLTARTTDRPELLFYFYSRDETGLNYSLKGLLDVNAVTAVAAYDSLGQPLARIDGSNTTTRKIPSVKELRRGLSVTEAKLIAMDEDQTQRSAGFLASLTARDKSLFWTAPILSHVNPVTKGLGILDFTHAPIKGRKGNSLAVIGYVQVAIDQSNTLREIRPIIGRFFVGSIIMLFFCAIPLYSAIRRSLNPLTQLAQKASQIITAGDTNTRSAPKSEFEDIAQVLRSVTESAAGDRYKSGLENKLLSMKVEERASQLSQRELELSKASEEIRATKDQLHRLANYDRLTSLPNRQLFIEQLELLLRMCARDAKPLAVLFINLKNFHRINESLGRSAGDLLLQEVGKRLVGCLRNSDVLAHYVNVAEGLNVSRLGGDEFAVVLNQIDNIDSAGAVAQRVIDQLVEPMDIQGQELVVNPCIGIAVAPRNSMDAEDLVRYSSTAMHHAKVTAGLYFLFYNEEMQATGQDDLKLESELRRAIERNQLRLHYQPQVNITNGSIICAEALLRWEHPDFGPVAPSRFIALAEKIGLIDELGDWVLVEACRQIKAFHDSGLHLPRISINISAQQFRPAFVSRLRQVLTEANLAPSLLELGLSEAILMENDSNVLKILKELKVLGVYLSLENFGTNHAPISYLSRHPLDEMKIDRSFVFDCDKRKDAARLVQAIIAMARSLELPTVAEGVETAGEYRFLAGNGVDIMRGYLFCKPVPADELQKLLVVPWHFMTQIQRMTLAAGLHTS